MIRLAVRVRSAQAEIVLAELLELAPGGVEETELDGGLIEYAVYGTPGELPELPDLQVIAGDDLVEVSSSEVADDWGERWKQFHRPVLVESPTPGRVPALHVRPPWAPAAAADDDDDDDGGNDMQEIVIDPGQAFGTGGHATTKLCLGLLLELAARGPRRSALLDVGTGSGVLAIAAVRLGYGPVLALDHDRASVAAAIENAQANNVAIEVRQLDLRRERLPALPESLSDDQDGRATVIVANLVRPLLLDLTRSIEHVPGDLIASGLLREEVDEIVGAFADGHGLRERERRASGEWAAVWLTTSAR